MNTIQNNFTSQTGIKHHCGVVGISAIKEINIPEHLFYPLFALQHRGQESAGIAYNRNNKVVFYKSLGMVSSVLSHYLTENHPSKIGIGHVRYSTQGANKIENAQPFCISSNKGQIAFAHNGNISNSDELRSTLFENGSIFQSTSDTELILHLLSRSQKNNFHDALLEVLPQLHGAFSGLFIHEDTLIAVRDAYGFRPLIMGKSLDITVFTSESCALDTMGIPAHEEVKPGEMVIVKDGRVKHVQWAKNKKRGQCIFELIYFARPDSIVFDYSVHMLRKKMGAALAAIDDTPGDIVISVPDSGNSAALGYAVTSGIPLEHGLTRNHYSGRTFIQPTPETRELGVRLKLHPIKQAITGKSVTIIDDSMVRGTTSKILIKLLREAGANKIHLRLSSPEIKNPCFFGIDIPTPSELISNRMSPKQISDFIGADSVQFLPIESLRSCVNNPDDFCYGCFNGTYPCPIKDSPMRRKD